MELSTLINLYRSNLGSRGALLDFKLGVGTCSGTGMNAALVAPPVHCQYSDLRTWPLHAHAGLRGLRIIRIADDACVGMACDQFARHLTLLQDVRHPALQGEEYLDCILPALQELSITCHNSSNSPSDEAVSNWVKAAPQLRKLELFGCAALTGAALITVAAYTHQLEHFAFVHYSEVAGSWGAQVFLLKKCSYLRSVVLHHTLAKGLEELMPEARRMSFGVCEPTSISWRRPVSLSSEDAPGSMHTRPESNLARLGDKDGTCQSEQVVQDVKITFVPGI
jgi:hypothetical protein